MSSIHPAPEQTGAANARNILGALHGFGQRHPNRGFASLDPARYSGRMRVLLVALVGLMIAVTPDTLVAAPDPAARAKAQREALPSDQILPLAVAALVAFVSGLAATHALLTLVVRGRLSWFGPYCLLVGVVALVWLSL